MLQRISKFRIPLAIFVTSLAFIIGGCAWAYVATKDIKGPIIVHFNNVTGIDHIGSFYDLLMIGITSVVVVLINFFLALELQDRDRFLSKIVTATTLFLSILIFITFAAIIAVN